MEDQSTDEAVSEIRDALLGTDYKEGFLEEMRRRVSKLESRQNAKVDREEFEKVRDKTKVFTQWKFTIIHIGHFLLYVLTVVGILYKVGML